MATERLKLTKFSLLTRYETQCEELTVAHTISPIWWLPIGGGHLEII